MDVLEATLRVLCMTDGKEGMHTLERQEEFVEIVKSRDVEVNNCSYYVILILFLILSRYFYLLTFVPGTRWERSLYRIQWKFSTCDEIGSTIEIYF